MTSLGAVQPFNSPGQIDRDAPGVQQLPRHACKNFNGIGAPDTNRARTETTGVRGVGVSADDQLTGEGIVLQNHLMDYPGAGLPETQAVFCRRGAKEVVDLLILREGIGAGPAYRSTLAWMRWSQ